MGYKLFAHANACILDVELIICEPFRSAWLLYDFQTDHTTDRCIFYGVVQQVQKGLAQPQPVAANFLMLDIHGIHIQF